MDQKIKTYYSMTLQAKKTTPSFDPKVDVVKVGRYSKVLMLHFTKLNPEVNVVFRNYFCL